MSATDGYVGLAPDSTGKKADAREITRVDGTVVERQIVTPGDPNIPANMGGVDAGGAQRTSDERSSNTLMLILVELRVISVLLANDEDVDLDAIREAQSIAMERD